MEGWKKSKECTEHDNTIPEGWKAGSQDESSEESELRRIEESMRAEVDGRKRKPEKSKGRKRKQLKLDLLVDWGLPEASI